MGHYPVTDYLMLKWKSYSLLVDFTTPGNQQLMWFNSTGQRNVGAAKQSTTEVRQWLAFFHHSERNCDLIFFCTHHECVSSREQWKEQSSCLGSWRWAVCRLQLFIRRLSVAAPHWSITAWHISHWSAQEKWLVWVCRCIFDERWGWILAHWQYFLHFCNYFIIKVKRVVTLLNAFNVKLPNRKQVEALSPVGRWLNPHCVTKPVRGGDTGLNKK